MKGFAAVLTVLSVLGASLLLPAAVPAQEGAAGEAPASPPGLIHTVESGETLWDLAAKHLGSPWRWQELWERNRFLTNPHYIYPGIKLVILPPPPKEYALTVAEAAPPAPDEAAPAAAEPAQAPRETAAPSPPAPSPPRPQTLDISPSEFVRAGEFVRIRPAGIGAIRIGREPKVAFAEGDKVFLSLSGRFPDGQLLGVYRVRGPIPVPGAGGVSGYVRYLVGLIQVAGTKEALSAGVVRASFEDLLASDTISEEIPGYSPVVIDPGAEDLRAVVISGRDENKELSTGDFVYLDKGANAGVGAGNVFRIFSPRESSGRGAGNRNAATVLVEVGRAVVVTTNPDFSTAVITGCTQSFPAGVPAFRGGNGIR